MRKYKCHKEVSAMKIEYCTFFYNSTEKRYDYRLVGGDGNSVEVNREFIERHNAAPGNYYVVYDDGYASISPAPAFEAGYSLVK